MFLKENCGRILHLFLFINLVGFKTFRMSLIPKLNMNYNWLVNLLEVNLKTHLDIRVPKEKQENQAWKNYTKHYLWQSDFHLHMWKYTIKEVNYHYYHFLFRSVNLVRKRLYNLTEIQAKKCGKEPVSLWIPACLFVTQPTMK